MIIGQPPKNAEKVYPCKHEECYSHMAWGLMTVHGAHLLFKPMAILDCEHCKHFEGFEFYKEM